MSYFSVYTRVDRYLPWIERQIGDRRRNQNRRRNGGRPFPNRNRNKDRRPNKDRQDQNKKPPEPHNRDESNGGVFFGD